MKRLLLLPLSLMLLSLRVPVNGPTILTMTGKQPKLGVNAQGVISVDAHGKVTTAWMREGKIFVSRPGEPEQLIGPGRNPVTTTDQNGRMVVWNTREEVLLLTSTAEKPVSLGKGSYPQLSMSGDGTRGLVCWEGDKGEIVYKLLPE